MPAKKILNPRAYYAAVKRNKTRKSLPFKRFKPKKFVARTLYAKPKMLGRSHHHRHHRMHHRSHHHHHSRANAPMTRFSAQKFSYFLPVTKPADQEI